MSTQRWPCAAALALLACNVTAAGTTGGADLPSRGDCARGLAVVSSDYQSSEIALLTPEAEVVSSAFLSSASTRATGLSAPISGDITVASRPGTSEVVVVDRFGTNVLTFVDTATAQVRAQLPVGTGFEANPQAYLELDAHHAFVPRLGENHTPGREPFDAGSDVLVIDPSVPAIVSSVPMPRKDGYLPNPSAVTLQGDAVLVTLVHARADFSAMADSELVALEGAGGALRFRLPLTGLQNCGRAELSPSGELLAVACSGFIDRRGNVAHPEGSALVLFDATQDPPEERQRFSALSLVGAALQHDVEFATEGTLLVKTQTAIGAKQNNALFLVSLSSGAAVELATAGPGSGGLGYGIALGGMSCDHTCGTGCFVADASRGALLSFAQRRETLVPRVDVLLGGAGLPPTGVEPLF